MGFETVLDDIKWEAYVKVSKKPKKQSPNTWLTWEVDASVIAATFWINSCKCGSSSGNCRIVCINLPNRSKNCAWSFVWSSKKTEPIVLDKDNNSSSVYRATSISKYSKLSSFEPHICSWFSKFRNCRSALHLFFPLYSTLGSRRNVFRLALIWRERRWKKNAL